MKVTSTFVLLFGLLCFAVSYANAFELEGYMGNYHFDSSVAEKAEIDTDNTMIFGLRFGSGARQIFSGETTIGYGPMEDIRIILLMGNFLINIPVDEVIPYVTVGSGTTIFLPKDVANEAELLLDTATQFTLNYGGGLRYTLNNFVALRFDFRDYVTFGLDFDTEAAVDGEPTEVIDVGTIHNTVFAGGLSLIF
jgi:hypothetical protein